MNLWVSLKLLLKCLGLSLCTPELLCRRGTLSIWLNKSSWQKFNFYAKISSLLTRCLESKVCDSPSLELFALELLSKALLRQLIFRRNYLKTPLAVTVQLLGPVRLFSTPWAAAGSSVPPSPRVCSNSRPPSLWCHRAIFSASFLLPSVFSSIRVFSNELALHIRWPKYWSFSFSFSLSNEYSGFISLESAGLLSL